MNKLPFIEAAFVKQDNDRFSGWKDTSTVTNFVFESSFGVLRLAKRHSFPETFAYVQGDVLYFGYGDIQQGKNIAEESLESVAEASFYGPEFMYGFADGRRGEVLLQRDASSTLPIIIAMSPNSLLLSNKYERTYELYGANQLHINEPVVARAIMGGYTGGRSILKELDILYDRQRLVWSPGDHHIDFPPHGSVIEVTRRQSGDPKEFRKRLEDTLDTYWKRYASSEAVLGAELSGGLDTSMINGYLALKRRPVFIISSVYDGTFKKSVELKIRDFAERFKVRIHKAYMNADVEYPFVSMIRNDEWQPFYHSQEIYLESIGKMAEKLARSGVTTIFRGVGGDELCDNIPDYTKYINKGDLVRHLELTDSTPAYLTDDFKKFCKSYLKNDTERARPIPLLSMSVAGSSIVGNNMYIDQGIWPVNPLADPRLYLYCQSLPIVFRVNKNIFRAYMEARQFPESIYTWPNENFTDFAMRAVGPHLEFHFIAWMENSQLAKMRWIDTEAAKKLWNDIINSNRTAKNEKALFALYCLLSVEANLQQANIESLTNSDQ